MFGNMTEIMEAMESLKSVDFARLATMPDTLNLIADRLHALLVTEQAILGAIQALVVTIEGEQE